MFAALIGARSLGIPEKWATALMGSLLTFGGVLYAFRTHLKRWSFWLSFLIAVAAHVAATFVLMSYIFRGVQRISIFLWYPGAFAEAILLLIVVKRIEEKFTGKHEIIKL
jgi:hypothetical protein